MFLFPGCPPYFHLSAALQPPFGKGRGRAGSKARVWWAKKQGAYIPCLVRQKVRRREEARTTLLYYGRSRTFTKHLRWGQKRSKQESFFCVTPPCKAARRVRSGQKKTIDKKQGSEAAPKGFFCLIPYLLFALQGLRSRGYEVGLWQKSRALTSQREEVGDNKN